MDAIKNAIEVLTTERDQLKTQLDEVNVAIAALEHLFTKQKETDTSEPIPTPTNNFIRYDAWTQEEDQLLAESCYMCQQDPDMTNERMLAFASEMTGRTPGACGYRWYRKIRPNLPTYIAELREENYARV